MSRSYSADDDHEDVLEYQKTPSLISIQPSLTSAVLTFDINDEQQSDASYLLMQLSYLGNGTGSNVDTSAVLTDSKNRTVLLAEGVVMPKFIIDKDERN